MIVKELRIPSRIRKTEALLRRLTDGHATREQINSDLTKIYAGYKGEKAIQYFLDFFPDNDFSIFYDLRIPHQNHHFQIDILLLSNSFALILEVKNIFGTLYFDQNFNQLIRTANNKEEGFPDPLYQVKRHQLQLLNWFNRRIKCSLPVEYFVVMANPSSLLKTDLNGSHLGKRVIHSHALIERIEELKMKHSVSKIDKLLKSKITKYLLQDHTPEDISIIEKYGIPKEHIIKGVYCRHCNTFEMKRIHGTWCCLHCKTVDKHAHIQAIEDYFLLLNSFITNQQARSFLKLSSIDTATRLLKEMNLPYYGDKKGRVYYPPDTHNPSKNMPIKNHK